MDFIQQLRRLCQQGLSGWQKAADDLYAQLPLIKKLYAKNGLQLDLTCAACPEQYDVSKDGEMIAYLRLRHGEFTVDCPGVGGEEIMSESPNGDGCFDTNERLLWLTKALRKIIEHNPELLKMK